MNTRDSAKFRATAGAAQGFGQTPQEALAALMERVGSGAPTPIVIWPYNQGDVYFTDAQQARLQELKGRHGQLTADEQTELDRLVEAAFDATTARAQALSPVKS